MRTAWRAAVVGLVVGVVTGATLAATAGPSGVDPDGAERLLEERFVAPLEAAGYDVEVDGHGTNPRCAVRPRDEDDVWELYTQLWVDATEDEVEAVLAEAVGRAVRRHPEFVTFHQDGGGSGTWTAHVNHRPSYPGDDEPPAEPFPTSVTMWFNDVDLTDGAPGAPWAAGC